MTVAGTSPAQGDMEAMRRVPGGALPPGTWVGMALPHLLRTHAQMILGLAADLAARPFSSPRSQRLLKSSCTPPRSLGLSPCLRGPGGCLSL